MATTSLFGPTPAELILAQQKEAQQEQLLRNQMIAQQGAEFGPFRGLYQAGLKFGDIGAQALTQSMFPQQIDPRLKKASDIQSILTEYADKDLTDPATLKDISGKLRQKGYTEESFSLAKQAAALQLQQEELGIKKATAGREARKEERDILKFFKENPEQTGPVLQGLATQLAQDPTNAALLDRYNKIAQAGTSGAMEVAAKEEKDLIDKDRMKSITAKNKAELANIGTNFDAGTRWNFERQSAIDLLTSYGYKPGDKLKGADQLNPELQKAQEHALRSPWESGKKPATTSTPSGSPSANPIPIPANPSPQNLKVGQVYQTSRGMAKWDGSQFIPVSP